MFTPDQYELMDFGQGRKLERFGPWILDRPCPVAERVAQRTPRWWRDAHGRFARGTSDVGRWQWSVPPPASWDIQHGEVTLELRPTPSGQVGVFPEQAANWDWITARLRHGQRPLRVLNLFAYTGGSTLAAAQDGVEVVHVDAARGNVQWARRNALVSGKQNQTIRWVVEDAVRFVQRELRRGRQYAAVILDPPTYGHGPHGRPWKLQQHLWPLLQDAARLCTDQRVCFLLTCHSPGFRPADAAACLTEALGGVCSLPVTARQLALRTADGRRLPAGVLARWPAT